MATLQYQGTLAAPGQYLLNFVTDDDYVVADDVKTAAQMPSFLPLVAVSMKPGSTPEVIESQAQARVVSGSVVFVWTNRDETTAVGTLKTWKAGKSSMIAGTSISGYVAASSDGAKIFYLDNPAMDASSSDIFVANSDGTGKVKIGTADVNDNCYPLARFAPKTNVLAVSYCEGGGADVKLVTVDGAGKITTIAPSISAFPEPDAVTYRWDPNGTKLFVRDVNNKGLVYPAAGGMATEIDADLADGYFTPDGAAIVYRTSTGALKRASATGAPNPMQLVAKDVNYLNFWYWSGAPSAYRFPGISPDGKNMIIAKDFDESGISDLWLASTTTPGAPREIVNGIKGAIFGAPFSDDNKTLIYMSDIVLVAQRALIGRLNVQPVAGGMAKQLGRNVWVAYSLANNKLAYNDNWKAATLQAGRADLKVIDLNDPNAVAKPLATQAEGEFYLNQARTKIAYTVTVQGQKQGIYIVDVP